MTTLIVKICGLSTADTLDAALDAGADMVGFVFFPPSPRHVSPAAATALADRARGRAETVALTVDADEATHRAIVEAVRPDWLQLHGREQPEQVSAVRAAFGLPVMKAVPIAGEADLAAVTAFDGVADRLLFDAKPPPDATRPGGLGRAFDWGLLERVEARTPFMLSGGLDPGNVAVAVAITRCAGVDVSSGVESAPGQKDAEKIRAFVRAAREAARLSSVQQTSSNMSLA